MYIQLVKFERSGTHFLSHTSVVSDLPSVVPALVSVLVPAVLAPVCVPGLGPPLGPALGPPLGPAVGPPLGPALDPSLGPTVGPVPPVSFVGQSMGSKPKSLAFLIRQGSEQKDPTYRKN